MITMYAKSYAVNLNGKRTLFIGGNDANARAFVYGFYLKKSGKNKLNIETPRGNYVCTVYSNLFGKDDPIYTGCETTKGRYAMNKETGKLSNLEIPLMRFSVSEPKKKKSTKKKSS